MVELYDYQQELVDLTRNAYANGYRAPCVVAPCGAGKSIMIAIIAQKAARVKHRVLFLVHRHELVEQIQNTFNFVGVDMQYVEIGMVQTVCRRLDKTPRPKLIITDENHHALAASYRKIFDYFGDVQRLGFTATPVRLNGSGLRDVNDKLIETVTVRDLIESQHLAPFRYFAPSIIDASKLKMSSTRDYTNKSMDDAFKRVIYGDVVKHYQALAEGEKAIAYCHSIQASKKTRDAFIEAGISSAHIDGKTPKEQRSAIIDDFRQGKIRVLCNVDLIGEGFDVPDCSTVIMLRPTKSLSLFVQQSMRGMRYRPGKTSIIIDHVGNVGQFGLPDTPRKWTLDGIAKHKKQINAAEGDRVMTCDSCFGVYYFKQYGNKCPYCGAEHQQTEQELKVEREAKLEEIHEANASKGAVTLEYRHPSDCRNMAELYELAKHKGYKPGWAYMQGKRLGLLNK